MAITSACIPKGGAENWCSVILLSLCRIANLQIWLGAFQMAATLSSRH